MNPTLVILAAGMGSRYGGMKQIDGVGSHGEPIIDFSIYDAYRYFNTFKTQKPSRTA